MVAVVPPRVELVGVPLDLGAGLRGVDMGPSAMRYAGLAARLRSLGIDYHDHGNLDVPVAEEVDPGDARARYAASVAEVAANVRDLTMSAILRDSVPVILGGDHSLSIGSLAGVLSTRPEAKVIWVDAHGDLNTPETTPSGNVHGMSLAVALGLSRGSFDSVGWDRLRLATTNLAIVGARDLDPDERRAVMDLGLAVFTMSDVDRIGIREVIGRVIERLDPGPGELHVSFDADAVDPLYAPGVGTPVPGGLSFREAHTVMELLAATGMVGSLEFVEVNPIRDRENMTGQLAAGLIASALGKTIV